MKRYDSQWAFIGLLAFFLTGCVTDYATPPRYQQEGRLVVEGTITAKAENIFILSRSVPLSADSAACPETGAVLHILCDDGTSFGPAEETEPGRYRIPMGALDAAARYCLEFHAGEETYRSEFLSPTFPPPIDSVHWRKAGSGQPLEIYVSTHDDQNPEGYYLWTFREDWEFTSNYDVHWFFNPDNGTFYYETVNPYFFCWNQDTSRKILIASTADLAENRIVNQAIHSIPCSDRRLSFLYCITVQQRMLSKEGYRYYKEKRTMNEEMGGIFTPQPSELKGNITCTTHPDIPVLGYIEVANMTEKRVFIEPDGIYEHVPPECTELHKWDLKNEELYRIGYRPVVLPETTPYPTFWVNKGCLECTETGTKNKPDFWPNDHK